MTRFGVPNSVGSFLLPILPSVQTPPRSYPFLSKRFPPHIVLPEMFHRPERTGHLLPRYWPSRLGVCDDCVSLFSPQERFSFKKFLPSRVFLSNARPFLNSPHHMHLASNRANGLSTFTSVREPIFFPFVVNQTGHVAFPHILPNRCSSALSPSFSSGLGSWMSPPLLLPLCKFLSL